MKLAISLLLLLAGTGFEQGNGGGISHSVVFSTPSSPGDPVCKDGDGKVFPCLSAGPGNGGGVGTAFAIPPCDSGWYLGTNGKKYVCVPPPDPVDVPAVQEPLGERGIALCVFNESDGVPRPESCDGVNGPKVKPTPNSSDRITLRWTCKDKTRILEHDEQTPPKYYCRKAQL